MALIDLKNCDLIIKDGGSRTLNVKVSEGSFSYNTFMPREYILDKGKLDTVRNGDEQPVEINCTVHWEYYTGTGGTGTGALPTITDVLVQEGAAAGWESTDDDECAPYAVDIELKNVPGCGTNSTETYTFSDFRVEDHNYDLSASTSTFSGKCNIVRPTAVRS
jgi:hypothetical protein